MREAYATARLVRGSAEEEDDGFVSIPWLEGWWRFKMGNLSVGFEKVPPILACQMSS